MSIHLLSTSSKCVPIPTTPYIFVLPLYFSMDKYIYYGEGGDAERRSHHRHVGLTFSHPDPLPSPESQGGAGSGLPLSLILWKAPTLLFRAARADTLIAHCITSRT